MAKARRAVLSIVSTFLLFSSTMALADEHVAPADVGCVSCHAEYSSAKYVLNSAHVLLVDGLWFHRRHAMVNYPVEKITSYAVLMIYSGIYGNFPVSEKFTAVSIFLMMDSNGSLILCDGFMRAVLSLRSA